MSGRNDSDRSQFKAYRLLALEGTAYAVAAIYNSAGKVSQRLVNPKTVFDEMTGHGPPQDDDEFEDESDSLAEARAARRERESRQPMNGKSV